MIKSKFKVKNLGGLTYLPAPEVGCPEGIYRRLITIRSLEFEESERDEISATLWDSEALLDISIGDVVIATIQLNSCNDEAHKSFNVADIVEIQKVEEYEGLKDY